MLSVLLLTTPFAGLLRADINVNANNTNLVLSGTTLAEDIISGGTGNSVEFQTNGTLDGGIIGTSGIPNSKFESLKMNGELWRFSGTADLGGTSATTLHVASGTLVLTGEINAANVTSGAAGVTIDSGATLKIGDNTSTGSLVSGTEGAFGIVNDGILWLARTGNYIFDNNVSGAGRIDSNYGTVRLTGTNTHTGGVTVASGNLYIEDSAALGSGALSILSGASLWVTPTVSSNLTINNSITSIGTGRIIVNMADGADVFAFGPGAGTGFIGSFILQVGSVYLSGDTDQVLSGASDIRLDRGASLYIGSGAHNYNRIYSNNSGASVGTPIKLSFEGDFSNTSDPVLSSLTLDTFTVSATTKITVDVHTTSPVVAPAYTPAPIGTNLLLMDDQAGNVMFTGTLLAMNPGKSIAAADLGRLMFASLDGNSAALEGASQKVAYNQGGVDVADLVYGYYTAADSDGIYLNYGLSAVDIRSGQTLTLSGDSGSGASREMSLRLTGDGNLDINATDSILLSNAYSNLTGLTTISTGTLIVSGSLGTGSVMINSGATLQIGNGSVPDEWTITPYAGDNIINNGTLTFRLGAPSASQYRSISSNISGTGGLTLSGGRVKLTGTNTFSGGLVIAYTEQYAGYTRSLGSGTVTINNSNSLWLLPDEEGDQVWTQPLNTVGNGRMIVRMFDADDVFSFQNGSNVFTSGTGNQSRESVIFQRGTYIMDNEAAIALTGRSLAVDGGTTLKVALGTQSFKSINFRSSDNSGLGYRILSFDADFSNPDAPVLSHLVLDAITITPNITFRFDSSTPIGPISTPSTPAGSNLLTMDDDAGNNVFSGTVFSFSSPSTNLSAGDLAKVQLDQQIYVNGVATDTLSVGGDFVQNGDTVGKLLYGYNLSSDSKGVYLNAGLAGIEVLGGKTLTLSGDTTDVAGANEFKLRMTGDGDLDVHATNSIIISNQSNTLTGMTTISSGTLLLTGYLPGGVTIDPGTTLQIGDYSTSGEVGGSLIHNGTLIIRRPSGTIATNISGSGQVVLDYGSNAANTLYLSGSNTHTGGVHFAGAAARYYISSIYALGSGTMSIAPTLANTRIDVYLTPKENDDFIINNAIAWSATNSRLIVAMPELDNKFGFGNAAESTFDGIFIGQRGTYELFGDTGAVLAGAASIRFDKGSSIILGNGVTTTLRNVEFSYAYPANNNDPYVRIVFDADFSDPQSPSILSGLHITEKLTVGTYTRIQLNYDGEIPIPDFTVPVFGSNILGVDDEINRDSFSARLISIEPGATITGAVNWLADMILIDSSGSRLNAANNFDFMQDGEKIGTGYVNYFIGQQADGLYMNYGFASLEIEDGKTLVLSGDTDGDNSFIAMLSGTGNVDIHATNSIKLGTYYGESTLTGTVTVHSGTLAFATPVALSANAHLELNPGTGMDFNFTNQVIGTINAPDSTTINLHAGRLTVAGSGTINSTLFGTGIITVNNNATLDVGGNNPGLDANWIVAPNAQLTFHSAGASGIGRVSGSNGSSVITVQNVSGGEFNAEVTGGGVFAITSSTLATTKAVTINNYNITESDVTIRHANGLNAVSRTEANDSIIRIDTSSHINAAILRLNNSSIAFVPQADGSFGSLLVGALETSGTTIVKMNADLTRHGAGDSIIITENIVGDYVLDITNVAPGNRGNDGVALRVVRVPDESELVHFTLKDGYLEAGVHTYELIQGDESNGAFVMSDPNSYYLAVAGANPLTRTAQAVLSTAAIAGAEWHYKLDSLSQRMGDLRREIEASDKDRFYNTWLRSSAYKLKAGRKLSGAPFDEDVYNFTFGADTGRRLGSGSATILIGVYGDIGYVDRDFDNRSTGRTNSYGGGLYATWLHQSGWYADFALKADTQQNKFTAHTIDNSEARGDYTGKAMGFSLELGRKIKLGQVWWIEPGVQVAAATFFKSDYETGNGIQVHVAENDSVQYRAQVRFGRENINGRFQPYGRLAYARSRSGSLDVTADGLALSSDLDLDDTRYELGIGASFLFNQKSQLYMEYEYATASHYDRPWAINIGFRRFW